MAGAVSPSGSVCATSGLDVSPQNGQCCEKQPGESLAWTLLLSKDTRGSSRERKMELVALFDFEGTHRKDPSLPPCRPRVVICKIGEMEGTVNRSGQSPWVSQGLGDLDQSQTYRLIQPPNVAQGQVR